MEFIDYKMLGQGGAFLVTTVLALCTATPENGGNIPDLARGGAKVLQTKISLLETLLKVNRHQQTRPFILERIMIGNGDLQPKPFILKTLSHTQKRSSLLETFLRNRRPQEKNCSLLQTLLLGKSQKQLHEKTKRGVLGVLPKHRSSYFTISSQTQASGIYNKIKSIEFRKNLH